ncbi:exodeoxyribonuclease VII small subunit [Paenimyroides ummariense]|uniref:Exodeoxyribonuclease VII small subunit n=1 Tax=Paenimyroides ummariense TaxID=913024 RepID=A0A1I5F438_9FLAO|nr:exodeoxyribonuclease VII small subunit [Paenimyroides ummariense]SFO18071.1 exodeoxyribonuclease VII small subunit [Paenimyroides ummariense]
MEELTYEKAEQELEQILDDLRNDRIGIDALAEKVERASKLIVFCKEKLASTEKKVDDIVKQLGL